MTSNLTQNSPGRSPRLPSPPPFPEVQLPPKSPGMPASAGPEAPELPKQDPNALRRIRPGTKSMDMASGPPLVALSDLDSPFQLQEHLKSLHAFHTRSATSPDSTIPITHATALQIAQPPPSVDRSLWLYELTRFLVMRANALLVSFFAESPPCSVITCPEMRASEWQYLCAVHEPPKPCCAIDYSCHTLDWAAYILTSQKHFPSRLTLGSSDSANTGIGTGGSTTSSSSSGVRQLTNIMRRVYRILSHAWYSHRSVFWEVEGREGLHVLFKTVTDVYDLMPEESYTIPREAEGLSAEEDEAQEHERRQKSPERRSRNYENTPTNEDEKASATAGPGATQRRHKATPSVGSAVTTIQESDEDDRESHITLSPESVSGLASVLPLRPARTTNAERHGSVIEISAKSLTDEEEHEAAESKPEAESGDKNTASELNDQAQTPVALTSAESATQSNASLQSNEITAKITTESDKP